jgi:alpha-beta hydrolase superfamily lysophospholipase
MSMLEEAGLELVALDLTGSGIDNTDMKSITTLEDYSKPLLNYLNALGNGEKAIVVAHSCGGASLSFAMEHCPGKISKAIFLAATMVKDGQRPFDLFTQEVSVCFFI